MSTEQRTWHIEATSTVDAVNWAVALARADGLVVVTVARVRFAAPGWDVTLAVRPKGAA